MPNERRFADWVAPVAAMLAEDRSEVIQFARSAPPELWARPTADEGWTCKDILAHLAGGNDELLQTVLRAAVGHAAIDSSALNPDTDRENARRVTERRAWTIDQLIAELVRDGDEIEDLLSHLTDGDRDQRQGSSMTLGAFLDIVLHERHDHLHLEQIRAAASQR